MTVALLGVCHSPAGASAADSCPNATFRTGSAAQLPDCRAYEQVSPVDKGGASVFQAGGNPTEPLVTSAAGVSPSGDAVTYMTTAPLPDAPAQPLYSLAGSRRSNDWTSKSIVAPLFPDAAQLFSTTFAVSPDQSKAVSFSALALAPGAVAGNGNYYVLDVPTGTYTLIVTFPDPQPVGSEVDGVFAVSNGGEVVFAETRALTPDAVEQVPGAYNLYEFSHGQLRMISEPGAHLDSVIAENRVRLLSDDGSRVAFVQVMSGQASVYMREDGGPAVPLAVSRRPGDPSTPQGAGFVGASADGSVVYFTHGDSMGGTPLTAGSSTGSSADLYRYDVKTDQLVDLTPSSDPADVSGPNVGGWAPGGYSTPVSEDGSYVYFHASGKLTPDATSNAQNLYASHGTETRLVATLSDSQDPEWEWSLSPDGTKLAFVASSRLTGFDNTTGGEACRNSYNPGHCNEVYLYDWTTDNLVCASCPKDGSGPARGQAAMGGMLTFSGSANFQLFPSSMTDDGTVFFDTPEQLVPEDINGRSDVYAYRDGQRRLISTGQSPTGSKFHGASRDGSSVFFSTQDKLVGQDRDNLVDLYDAKVDGGIAGQWPAPERPACVGDDCRSAPVGPSPMPVAATVTFAGAGDLAATRSAVLKAKVSSPKVIRGPKARLEIRVPRAGSVSITGSGLRRATRSIAKPGSYAIVVSLTSKARRSLQKQRAIKVTVRVRYAPQNAPASSTTIRLTFKPPRKANGRASHASARHSVAKGGR